MIIRYVFLWILALLSGCAAPSKAVDLEASFWNQPGTRVGIVMTAVPAPRPYVGGTMGLLDVAITQGVTSDLSKHLAGLDVKRINALPARFEKMLAGKGFAVTTMAAPISPDTYPAVSLGEAFASRDYSTLGNTLQVDTLLVINIQGVGTARDYKGFIPHSPPSAYFKATGQLVDLKTKKLLWQRHVQLLRSAQSEWDQPPDYPRLTQKVQETIEAGTSLLETDFSWRLK